MLSYLSSLSIAILHSLDTVANRFYDRKCNGVASLGNMQISNTRLCESSKCWVYSAVNHPWWMSMFFHRRGLLWLVSAFVTFGGSGGIMTTAGQELPYPCSP